MKRFLPADGAELGAVLDDLENLPIPEVGALSVDRFMSKEEGNALAAALNNLLASPTGVA